MYIVYANDSAISKCFLLCQIMSPLCILFIAKQIERALIVSTLSARPICYYVILLGRGDSTYRAYAFAGAAINANRSVYHILLAAIRNSTYRTFGGTRAAGNAVTTDFISHNLNPFSALMIVFLRF